MKPKEKAEQIVSKYMTDYGEKMPDGSFMLCVVSIGRAKQCARICCDEILDCYQREQAENRPFSVMKVNTEYWEQVKEEIEKL